MGKNVRRHARAVRRAGAKLAGIKAAKTIGEASVVGAVAEVFGLNFFLSVVGLQLVPANILQKSTTAELDTTMEEETVDKLSDEQIAGYKSEEDPDYVPSGATEESADDDSDAEEKMEEVVEDLTEEVEKLKEVVNEVVEEVVEDIKELIEEIEVVVGKTENVVEDEGVAEKTEDTVEEVVEDIEELIEEIEEVVAGKTENVVEEA